jgi:chromate transporter
MKNYQYRRSLRAEKETPSYFELFLTFFRIGLTAFGGLAMFAYVRKYVVDKKGCMDANTFDSGLALCQVIPGAIIMQLTAFIGLKVKGIRGAIVCFIGFGLPAFLIMLVLSVLYKKSQNITGVDLILISLRVLIVAIVANAAFTFGKRNLQSINDWIISVVAAALFLIKIHPALVLLIAGLMGLLITKKDLTSTGKPVKSRTFRFFLLALALTIFSVLVLFVAARDYFTLSTIMLRIDLFSFGGGLASMPIMYHELVDLHKWFDAHAFMDGAILGQVTPGSIIIAATFFGYMHFGLLGSLLATIYVFTPSFLIFMGIIPFFDKLSKFPQFNKVINGILCSFVGLLVIVTYRFAIDIHWNLVNILFVLTAFVLLLRKVDLIWIISGGVIMSILIHWLG